MLSIVETGPPPAVPRDLNLAAHVLARGAAHPDRIALAVLGPGRAERWSYARLSEAVARAAAWIAASDVPPGGRILLRLGNSPGFPVAFLAAIAAGRVPVPTPQGLTGPEISRIAAALDPALVIGDGSGAMPETPAPAIALDTLTAAPDAPLRFAATRADAPAYIVFTSGSSGRPRGVVHAHRAILARAMMIDGWTAMTATDRVMHAGTFNWTYTLGTGLLDPWTLGATALVPAPGTAPETLALLIARHDVTLFAAVPGIFRRLLRHETLPRMPRLRHALSAGEKLPPSIRRAWSARTGTDIHEAFGQSECSTFLSGSPARPAPPDSLGYAQTGRRVAVLGHEGPVPRGEIGELAVDRRDPGLMLGYLDAAPAAPDDRPEDTPDAAWHRTGDRALMAADGAVHYHGRGDDVMTAGGFRVSPHEVETAAHGFAGVSDAAACDIAVAADTRIIALFYVADGPVDEAKLAKHLAASLAPFKRPRRLTRLDALPRSANGKLDRRALADPDAPEPR